MSRTPLVAGNWKMHGSTEMTAGLVAEIAAGAANLAGVEVLVCPPYPYLAQAVSLAGSVSVGAQDVCDQAGQGAYTGEVNGAMLKDIGCTHAIIGHSERRQFYGDSNELVAAKFIATQAAGLVPVLCIGEMLEERESGNTENVLAAQLDAVVQAGRDRFRPIILTSITTFIGLLPIMFERSIQAQFLIPMVVSLAFGVLCATFVTLILVPNLYKVIETLRFKVKGDKVSEELPVSFEKV